MTPEGRQDLAAVIAEMQELGDRLAYQGEDALAIRVVRWADRLALLLAEAPQVQEETDVCACDGPQKCAEHDTIAAMKRDEDTRMDRRSTSSDASRTAAPDVAEGDRSMTPDQERHQLREQLAALCHEQWSGWMTYLFSRTFPDNEGNAVIPRDWAARWRRQIDTPYSHLARHEQNSDRKEADRVIAITTALAPALGPVTPTEDQR